MSLLRTDGRMVEISGYFQCFIDVLFCAAEWPISVVGRGRSREKVLILKYCASIPFMYFEYLRLVRLKFYLHFLLHQ